MKNNKRKQTHSNCKMGVCFFYINTLQEGFIDDLSSKGGNQLHSSINSKTVYFNFG